jgi:TusA-related sulfurtransferase
MGKQKEVVLDIRGQVCPSSLLITLRSVNEHRVAINDDEVVLKVMTDSRDAIVTIPNAVHNMGFIANFEKMQDGHYELSIAKQNED